MAMRGDALHFLESSWNPSALWAGYPERSGGFNLKSGYQLLGEPNRFGGQRGIRTLVTFNSKHAFQACAIDHSAICPLIADPIRSRGEE